MLKFQQKGVKMEKFLPVLKKVPLFSGIEDEELTRMLCCLGAKIKSFDKKSTVFSEGDTAKFIGIVLEGSVMIYRDDYLGNRSILGESYEGELFAESFACAELDELPVAVVTNEKSAVMLIECAHILHTCHNGCSFHHRLIFNLMRDLATKNIDYHTKLEIISKRTTREKLLAYLEIKAKQSGSPAFEIPFDRQELADYLEVERSGLSSEIGKMKKEGIIDAYKNHFKLLV